MEISVEKESVLKIHYSASAKNINPLLILKCKLVGVSKPTARSKFRKSDI